jgi:predicted anti-sigma-YlaC factor YlaD
MHEEITMLMSLALDGQATPKEEARLREHLGACSACAAIWEDWKTADRLLSSAPCAAPSSNLLASLSVRIEEYEARRQRARRVGLAAIGAGVLLSFAVIALMGLYLGWSQQRAILDLLLAAFRQVSGAILWTVRGLATFARSAGWQGLALGVGFYLMLAGVLIMMWLSLVGRSRSWSAGRVTTR